MTIRERMSAQTVLSRYWDGTVPVPVILLASKLGIKVFKRADMTESGYIYLCEESQEPRIVFNENEPHVRQRFTIAHEIGHYALGHLTAGQPEFRDTTENFSSRIYKPKEAEANSFAAQLLMPQDAIEMSAGMPGLDIWQLAQIFEVSELAMKYRLKNLGMLRG